MTCASTEQINKPRASVRLITNFSRASARTLTEKVQRGSSSIIDSAPTEAINRDSILGRVKHGRSSVLTFDKQHERDDSMYKQNMQVRNIALENQRDERLKHVEERKKNRHKYRTAFSKLQKQLRKGRGSLDKYKTSSKFYFDGTNSEFM